MADCTVTGVTKDIHGAVVSGVKIHVKKVNLSGTVIKNHDSLVAISNGSGVICRVDSSGVITATPGFIVPQSSRIWLYGYFFIGSTDYHAKSQGIPADIPASSTVTLESLGAAVSGPTAGVTVQDNGSALANLISTFNFRNGFTITETPTGVARIDADAASGGTWGGITGDLEDQTDLQAALDAKLAIASTSVFGRSLIDDADATAARTTLGLGTAATQNTGAFEAAGAVASAIATHEAAVNPHPGYLTQAEGDALYAALSHSHTISNVTGLQAALDLKAPLASPTFTGTVTLPNDTVAFAKMQNIATARILGRTTVSSGDIEELNAAAVASLLGLGSLATVTPTGTPDGTKFLRDDNSWQSVASAPGGVDTELQFNDGGSFAGAEGFQFVQGEATVLLQRSAADAGQAPAFAFFRTRGDIGSETVVQDHDVLGEFAWGGYHTDPYGDGPDFAITSYIYGYSGEEFNTVGSAAGYLSFLTTPLGSVDLVEQLKTGWTHDVGGGVTSSYNLWLPANVDHDHNYAIFANAPDEVGERWVWRLKNGVTALYNKDFGTLYTAGQANFERLINQWDSDEAQIGVEVGGTGTLRPLRFLGSEVRIENPLVLEADTPPTLANGQFTFTLDEANDQILFTVKYSDGTDKAGAIGLG